MSQKKLLLANSDSENGSIDPESGARIIPSKSRLKSIMLHTTRKDDKKSPIQILKVAKENAISYEEFLDILQKPQVFVLKWSSQEGCCRRQKYSHVEITNLSGGSLLKGKFMENSLRIFDNRNRLFMVLDYSNKEREGVLSVPNSSIPLATLKKLPTFVPYNKRYQTHSDHFPELNYNVEHQTMENRYNGSLFKYTVTSGRKTISKLLQPSHADQMYILVDENVSVFQKSGILATAIFIGQRSKKNVTKLVCISLIFFIIFILGFVVVFSTVFDLRHKNSDSEGLKFPLKLKSADEAQP